MKQALDDAVRLTDGKVDYVVTDNLGKNVNAYYDPAKSVVYISSRADTQQAARAILSHEITHSLEGTDSYGKLADYALKEMKGNTKYDPARYLSAYAQAHPDASEETLGYIVQTEMVADYVANELLSDEKAVRTLVKRHESLARRIYNWIKEKLSFLRKSGADRETARNLSHALNLYEAALKESKGGVSLQAVEAVMTAENVEGGQVAEPVRGAAYAGKTAAEGARFSIENRDGKQVVVVDSDQHIFEGVEEKDYPKVVRKYMLERFQGNVYPVGTSHAFVNRNGIKEYTYPANRRQGADTKISKMRAGTELDNLLKVAEYVGHEADDGRHPDAVRGWDKYKTRFTLDGKTVFEGEISIKLIARGDLFYDITKIKDTSAARTAGIAQGDSSASDKGVSKSSIPQNGEKSTEKPKKVEETQRYSIAKVNGGRKAVVIEEDILAGVKKADYARTVREAMQKFAGGIPVSNGRLIKVNAISRNEYVNSKNTQYYKGSDNTLYKDKMNAGGHLDEIVLASDGYINEGLKHSRKDSFKEFARGNVLLNIAGRQYAAQVIVGFTGKDSVLYDVVDFKPTKFEVIKKDVVKANSETRDTFEATTSSTISISQNGEKSTENAKKDEGGRYSLVRDSEGRELTEEQAEFFKDSKVVDSEGRLLEVYHGTSAREIVSEKWNAERGDFETEYKDFTVFKQDPDDENIGFFFASDYDNAGGYGNRVYSVYLNLENPLVIDCNNADYSVIRYNGQIKDTYDWVKWAKRKGYDGVIFKNIRDGAGYEYMQNSIDEYVAFHANQIKKVTKPKPTTHSDIRYSLPLTGKGMQKPPHVTKVLSQIETRKKSVKERAVESYETTQIKVTNAQAGIEHAAKRLGVEGMETLTHAARAARNMAEEMLFGEQYSRDLKKVGKSLQAIFKPVYEAAKRNPAYKEDFFYYLLHLHNADRMRVKKPVFSSSVPAGKSRAEAARLLALHPEFQAIAEEVWKYNDNLLQYEVDSGLYPAAKAEELRQRYPHYVPTYRDKPIPLGTGSLRGKYNLAVADTVKTATGGSADILPLDVVMARRTMQVIKAARVNDVGLALWEGAERAKNFEDIEIVAREKLTDYEMDFEDIDPKNNEIKIFKDGKKVTMRVSPAVFEGFKAFTPADPGVENILVKGTRKVISVFKKLVTEYNPFFTARNFIRDLQEALIYTKHPTAKFVGAMLRAARQIKNGGELWQKYKAMGGASSSMFDFNKGVDTEPSKAKKVLTAPLTAISKANGVVEQLPRLAEFILSVEAGKSYEQAF